MKVLIVATGLMFVSWAAWAQEIPVPAESDAVVAEEGAAEEAPKFCPICGPGMMLSDPEFVYEYEGKTYGFCSLACLNAFKNDPEKFVPEHDHEAHAHGQGDHEGHDHESGDHDEHGHAEDK